MQRKDSYSIKQDKFEITSQGFLVTDATLTRSGVFDYYENGELVRELRSEEEVFSKDSLDSLKFVPLTFEHPTELVDIKNIKKYDIGSVGEIIERDGKFIKAKVIVKNKPVIDFILDKHSKGESIELSCGYTSDIIEKPGIHDKEGEFHKVQTNIRYNHLSIVEKGRAGEHVKLKLDKQDEVKNMNVKEIKLDDLDQVKAKFKEDADKIASLEASFAAAKEESEQVKKDAQEMQEKFDALKAEKEKLDTKLAEIKEDAEIEKLSKVAEKIDLKVDGLNSNEIKVAIIKTVKKDFDESEKSDEEINARFDMAIEIINDKKSDEGVAKLNAASGNPSEGSNKSARDLHIEKQANRYKNK